MYQYRCTGHVLYNNMDPIGVLGRSLIHPIRRGSVRTISYGGLTVLGSD